VYYDELTLTLLAEKNGRGGGGPKRPVVQADDLQASSAIE